MKDKDTLLLEEAYDTISDKTKVIDKFLRSYFMDIRTKYNVDKHWSYQTKPNQSYLNVSDKLNQFYASLKYKEYIDNKLAEYGLTANILSKPTPQEIQIIRNIDLLEPIV